MVPRRRGQACRTCTSMSRPAASVPARQPRAAAAAAPASRRSRTMESMAPAHPTVLKTCTLVTADGVAIDTLHLPGPDDLAIVVAHGFTQSWQAPGVWKVTRRLNRAAGVVVFDFRGHGRSGGRSTLGDAEIRDVAVAVAYARELGYRRVVTVGFSMGASVALRHAALIGGVDAVVSVSGPGWWYYRGTWPMRRLHLAVEHRIGRLVTRARLAPVPLLIVHGDRDLYFPVEHAQRLFEAAHQPKELWIEPGFGHAESAAGLPLLDRIGSWARQAALADNPGLTAAPDVVA